MANTKTTRRRNGRDTAPSIPVEWLGGRLRLPSYVLEDEPYRPELLIWLELPSGLVVGHGVVGEDGDGAFARALREALKRPTPGAAREPAKLRVADRADAAELQSVFGDRFDIQVAPTPELDVVFAQFLASMPKGDEQASYLEGGRVPLAAVARMFKAAALLYRAAPWKVASDDEVLRMDIPALGVEGACVSIIGALGESLGVIVFSSLLAYERFGATAEQATDTRSLDLGGPLLSLDFWSGRDVPKAMRREIAAHGWTTVAPDAIPVVGHRDRNGVPRPLAERDVRIATECAFAVASFFLRHRDAFGGGAHEPISESSTVDDDGMTVRLTLPYEAAHEFEPIEPSTAFQVETKPAGASGKVGRNDPCPCGSGKKHKKCCLGAQENRRAQERRRASVHELDERVVWILKEFAAERYGDKWESLGDKFVRAAGSSEPLLVQLSAPWSVYAARVEGRRVVDSFLGECGRRLSSEECAWLAAQQQAVLSIWEVTDCDPGVALTARDLLSGETRRILEVRGSRALVARDAVLGRVVDFEGASYFCGMYPRMLPPDAAARVVASVRRRTRTKGCLTLQTLADEELGLAMVRTWARVVREEEARAAAPKKLVNTDGETLLMTIEHFEFDVAKRAEIQSKLRAVEGLEADDPGEAGSPLPFYKQGNAIHAHWENTVLGHVTIEGDRLRLESNSIERADRLRARVETGCGGLLRHRAREHADPLSSARPRSRAERESAPPPPEAEEALREFKARHYAHWLDTPLPSLGGKTPRQTARNKRGREQVDLLLRSIENAERRAGGGAPFDFGLLRRELGMDAERGDLVQP
jgi:hypothetical protein